MYLKLNYKPPADLVADHKAELVVVHLLDQG